MTKVVILTGATGGIGRSIIACLVREGHAVCSRAISACPSGCTASQTPRPMTAPCSCRPLTCARAGAALRR